MVNYQVRKSLPIEYKPTLPCNALLKYARKEPLLCNKPKNDFLWDDDEWSSVGGTFVATAYQYHNGNVRCPKSKAEECIQISGSHKKWAQDRTTVAQQKRK